MFKKLIVIEGPTGVGKTAYAIEMAKSLDSEIISADSRQLYKELNIGVARPDEDELAAVPHHFIAKFSIQDYYSVWKYEQEVLSLLEILFEKHDQILLVGGSGLYVKAILEGIDELPDPTPELRAFLKEVYIQEGIPALQKKLKSLDPVFFEQIDKENPNRLLRALEVCISTGKTFSELRKQEHKERPFAVERIILNRPKEILYERINQRVDSMLTKGLLDEVKALLPYRNLNALNTVGYKEFFPYFDGKIDLSTAIEKVKIHSRRYAKRQLTWLRAYGGEAKWVDLEA